MASAGDHRWLVAWVVILTPFISGAFGIDIFLEWNVAFDYSRSPLAVFQPVIAINGMFPGPIINATTNDVIHVNIFNNLDEPFLMTWNGIEQRRNSWQDGVSGTNCPIKPGENWTYVFQIKDQIGSFFYFPSINFHKAAGGYGPIRVNNRNVVHVPFNKPDDEFDLLIGDWYDGSYKNSRELLQRGIGTDYLRPQVILMNGKAPYGHSLGRTYESFTVTRGKTYRFRISNVGNTESFTFKIQDHQMVLVETEGSYTNQILFDSLDVHVGQSYSVLVTADQIDADYYMVASPLSRRHESLLGLGVLHYTGSTAPPSGSLLIETDPHELKFSVHQAKSIKWNMSTGAARPNPQGTFNVRDVNPSRTFILQGMKAEINGATRYAINNVAYLTPTTSLKLADFVLNGSGVYQLDAFPADSINRNAAYGTSVVSGIHRSWTEIVFKNHLHDIDSWHLDGFGFYVVGFGLGHWSTASRESYNLVNPVVRSTVQVYPRGWTAVYVYLDNPGMWNLRSQLLKNWYLGQEMYIRVHDSDPDLAKELPPPDNVLGCGGIFIEVVEVPAPAAPPQESLVEPIPPAPSPQINAASPGIYDTVKTIALAPSPQISDLVADVAPSPSPETSDAVETIALAPSPQISNDLVVDVVPSPSPC